MIAKTWRELEMAYMLLYGLSKEEAQKLSWCIYLWEENPMRDGEPVALSREIPVR